ncbi:MAG: hypothetical protein ABEJ83_05675 [Candidatus Nanohaloarchaea archaeon]
MSKNFNDLDLAVRHPDSLHHIETQLNRLTTKIAHTDMVENEEARQEFFHLIMDFKEENQSHFSFETWKRVGLDLANLMKYGENQIAQGIIEHLRHDIHENDSPRSLVSDKPETMRDVKYVCNECGNSWNSVEYLEEFDNQGLRKEDSKNWKRLERTVVHNFFRTRDYPNDFEPVPQNCPVCNNGLSVDREDLSGDLEAVKIKRDREDPGYESKLEDLAPHGYEEVDSR